MQSQDGVLLKLIVGQMAMEGVPKGAIEFFKHSYDLLGRDEGGKCVEMSRAAFTTRQNANRHVNTLQKAGYLERKSKLSWRLLKDRCLTDPDFLSLFEMNRAMTNGTMLMI